MTKLVRLSDSIETSLGSTLQQLRQARGLSQTELGSRLGVSLQQVQKYESGRDRIAASTAFRAAEILGVDAGALFAGLRKASERPCRSSQKRGSPVAVIPLTVGPRAAPAREIELIDLIRHYQALPGAADRALARQLLKRLAAGAGAARSARR